MENPEKHQVPARVEQPTPVAPMSVNSRNVNTLPLDSEGKRDWSSPLLCGCGEGFGFFCLSMCCPCFVHTRNLRRIRHLDQHGTPDPQREELLGDDAWFGVLLEAMCNVTWVLQMGTRRAIRDRYNIQGTSWSDCCVPMCCQPCDLVQGHREIQFEERYLLGEHSSTTTHPEPVNEKSQV